MGSDEKEVKGDLSNTRTSRRIDARWCSIAAYEDVGSWQVLGDAENIALKKGRQAGRQGHRFFFQGLRRIAIPDFTQ